MATTDEAPRYQDTMFKTNGVKDHHGTALTAGMVCIGSRVLLTPDGEKATDIIFWYVPDGNYTGTGATSHFLCYEVPSFNEEKQETEGGWGRGFLWVKGGDIANAHRKYNIWKRKGCPQNAGHMAKMRRENKPHEHMSFAEFKARREAEASGFSEEINAD